MSLFRDGEMMSSNESATRIHGPSEHETMAICQSELSDRFESLKFQDAE